MNESSPNHTTARCGVDRVLLYRFREITDPRGSLLAAEYPTSLPFIPHRYFTVFNVPNTETRGEHAHYACHQFLICTHGSVTVEVDDGIHKDTIVLDHPAQGLYLPPMIWASQFAYSPDATVLVLASHTYDADDYIRDYTLFQQAIGKDSTR